jgi:putative ABC transport system permease protein
LNILRLSWLTIVRQPARTTLAVLGVAAVGALLFDMLLLSRGLVLSFRDLLDRAGYDVRVLATDAPLFAGPRIPDATAVSHAIGRLPEVESVLQLRLRAAVLADDSRSAAGNVSPESADRGRSIERSEAIELAGVDPGVRPMWALVEGKDLPREALAPPAVVINRNLARSAHLEAGGRLALRCGGENSVLPPMTFTVSGIVDFPFDDLGAKTTATSLENLQRVCGETSDDRSEILLVRSRSSAGAAAAAAAIHAVRPELHVVTNEELVERFSRVEFSYFRQISAVLATVTLFFGFLLVAVLLTVSVNQRLGEIAALRAVGLSRWRVVAGELIESVFLVFTGGLLALPLGLLLSLWLDAILRGLPGVPADLHFFVFEPRALVLHVGLLAVASLAAAAYPMRIVATLPIAATLRREVVS